MQSRSKIKDLLRVINVAACSCPAHSRGPVVFSSCSSDGPRKETAFEMSCSTVRYGPDVIKEVGMDLSNMQIRKACIMTDVHIGKLPCMQTAVDSLTRAGISFEVYDNIGSEPTEKSLTHASDFCRAGRFDGYVALGGGSVLDTCKAANLYASDPRAQFLDYVNPPIGKGKPVTVDLKPMIAIPTTSGTGSEVTAVSVFDYKPLKVKTGIANRKMLPTLALIDPLPTLSVPKTVVVHTGFDQLCHALESFTTLPYNDRMPAPTNPNLRPAYQGRSPLSDIWSRFALVNIEKYFRRSAQCDGDVKARSMMHLGATAAGIGFGNAGVHLCHAMSYPISGLVKTFVPQGYSPKSKPVIPHGLAVIMTAPAVFEFTSKASPERHLEAAQLLGRDISNDRRVDAGKILADTLRCYMQALNVENGLTALGYTKQDIPLLVKGTLPQQRLTGLAPLAQSEEQLATIFENSMTVY
ncbi:probable hydroxyacid-oxoacid transhydrogenase, mitochondrial [Ctenocephalides felis]|uniref:probable hydroxyacid-oxoacid transhydrogenase, mitochondrial n=1 Tax=Ctenocephalides felis TaxID=7515 RepID=UPI000E6E3B8B|nr:probable hydroxyacid-oxoacid transhydrogenase, mitochondrial [Ctenocephalides felis]